MPHARRRILLVVTDLEIGGTPTVVRELALRLSRAGIQPGDMAVQVACLAGRGPVAEQIERGGVRVTALNARGPADVGAIFRLWRLVRREKFDVVLSFLLHANAASAAACALSPGVRLVQSIQTTQPEPPWHWRVQRLIAPLADRVLAATPSVARVARQWAGAAAERIVIIPNAVDARAMPLAARGGRRIGFLGRLDPIKRVGDLIAALPMVEHATLEIFGDGPERGKLVELAARLGVANRVTFHGAVTGPGEALGKMDVLALPSAAEGFGLVLIEAMAAGVPVVGTEVPGIWDVVEDGRNGLLVRAGDVEELAGAMERILDRPEVARRLIEGGLRAVRERYDWTVVLGAYWRLLMGLR